ncbi:cellulase family glycosylhydrolase [Halomicrobium salinisoli]|uniref:cellulase family glycosylhydrolase n=1 Tax=Halomicrobium salinisoli TaxID=2878391 RepID=UPI001CEFC596|nr:cellulase family glycosylhydrolase [Halomicrobium salinisoli]
MEHTYTRRDLLRTTAAGAIAGAGVAATGATASAEGASFGDGVNLQPSYFCSGDQELGWELMNQYPDIDTVRIEIEPFSFGEVATTVEDAKRWIDEAGENGKHVVATYHHYPDNGSADASALQNAAEFWVEHYETLSRDTDVVVNMMNEWGNHEVTADEYASAYDEAISTVREGTSYDGPIVCDAPGWGQGTYRLADAAEMIDDDDLILSAHVYPSAYNSTTGQSLVPEDLDAMDETDYPCMIGEFGNYANSTGADWSAIVDYAKELGWPVIGWAWNGDGSDDPMNMADPYWGDDCSASSYTESDYFDVVYDKLGGGSTGDATAPSSPSNLSVTTSESSVTVSWDAASDAGGSGLAEYVVSVAGNETTVPAGTTEATVDGLDPDTEYEVSVVAVDGAGNASDAATVAATTDDGTSGATVSVVMPPANLVPGHERTASVLLSEAPGGVSGFDLTVSVSDTSVATIESAAVGGDMSSIGSEPAPSDDGSTAVISGADLSESVSEGATEVELATVTLAGQSDGETDVGVDVSNLDGNAGDEISVSTRSATLTVVSPGPDWPDGATDPDDDGLYEDLNGNGEVDYDDVVEYFGEMESDGMQRNVEYYDYNGNDQIDYADVVDLFTQVD